MHSSKHNKRICVPLHIDDVYTKQLWVNPLEDEKDELIVKVFKQKFK